ncbi:hypothetical protein ACJJTC_013841 [Scirpophaga incertulas]
MIQCSQCNKWSHATCVAISSDQLSALSSTVSIDWKCKSCAGSNKQKRISCIVPDREEDTDTETVNTPISETQKNLSEIRREVKEIIRGELQRTLQFYSDKIDEYESKLEQYEKTIKCLENQCADTKNKLKNISLKHEALETKINQIEQHQISNQLDIWGIKEKEQENIEKIAKTIATKIQQNPEDILKVYRKRRSRASTSASKTKESTSITVILRDGVRDLWLESAKAKVISTAEIGIQEPGNIYLRESLTPSTAFLLWKTKEELKGLYKYIWCKRVSADHVNGQTNG